MTIWDVTFYIEPMFINIDLLLHTTATTEKNFNCIEHAIVQTLHSTDLLKYWWCGFVLFWILKNSSKILAVNCITASQHKVLKLLLAVHKENQR